MTGNQWSFSFGYSAVFDIICCDLAHLTLHNQLMFDHARFLAQGKQSAKTK